MFFEMNSNGSLPLFEQIVYQVKFAVASGALRPGQFIPSVRDMAKRMAVNPNTVAKAYRDLKLAGIVEQRRGTGLAIASTAPEICRGERGALIRRRLREVLLEAQRSHIETDALRAILDEEWEKISSGDGAADGNTNGEAAHPATDTLRQVDAGNVLAEPTGNGRDGGEPSDDFDSGRSGR